MIPSDARSGAVVDERIRPALESGAAIGSSKPVLVIVDEIDGATGAGDNVRVAVTVSCLAQTDGCRKSAGFIQRLIALTQNDPKKKRGCLWMQPRYDSTI